ncbi:MAG: hypothetical protein ACUVWP_02005 [bacterium]
MVEERGYKWDADHIIIYDLSVQFLFVNPSLIREAVENAKIIEYKGTTTYIINKEYLMAILLRTYRPKDRKRLTLLMESKKYKKIN